MTHSGRRVAMITGSGRKRVGNVIARSLAADGYAVALHYHSSTAEAHATAAELRQLDVECEPFAADVANENEVNQLFDQTIDRFGRLDVLVTTASIWESISLDETDAEAVLRSFRVNTLGTFLCAKRAGLQMATQPEGGSIITIGDWAISRPYRDHTAYFISKGAIPTLTRLLAVELAHRNPKIRVNCIHPGPVMFPPDCGADERQDLVESTLVKHADEPQVMADAVKFLIGNSFITGVCLPVDGGRTIFSSESDRRQRPI